MKMLKYPITLQIAARIAHLKKCQVIFFYLDFFKIFTVALLWVLKTLTAQVLGYNHNTVGI